MQYVTGSGVLVAKVELLGKSSEGAFMKFDYVSIEKRDGVAIVRFDRKANLNAFNEKLVVELTHACLLYTSPSPRD